MSVILRHYRDLGDSFCAGIFLTSRNDVIEAHMSGSCINSIFGYAPAANIWESTSVLTKSKRRT